MSPCAVRASDASHLPYAASEEAYYDEALGRYRSITDDVDSAFASAGVEADGDDGFPTGSTVIAGGIAAWVGTQIAQRGLSPNTPIPSDATEYDWFDALISESYHSGQRTGQSLLREAGIDVRTPGIRRSSNHQHALNEVYRRQRRYWNDLAGDVQTEVRDAVSASIRDGQSLQDAQRVATDRLRKVGEHRARYIAQSEPAYAFNRGALEEYRDAGIEGVGVDTRWETAGDQNVCAECSFRSGTYSLGEMEGMMEAGEFPAHPLCRCLLVPARSS